MRLAALRDEGQSEEELLHRRGLLARRALGGGPVLDKVGLPVDFRDLDFVHRDLPALFEAVEEGFIV